MASLISLPLPSAETNHSNQPPFLQGLNAQSFHKISSLLLQEDLCL